MTVITTRITISPDDTAISTATPIPAGEHIFSIEVRERPSRQLPILPFDVDALPKLGFGPWPQGVSLRRENTYGDDGR